MSSQVDVLPDEILEKIFSYVPLVQIKRSLSLVCRRWCSVAQTSRLVTQLYFGPSLTTPALLQVLRNAPSLQRLSLYCRSDLTEILYEATVSNTKLTTLKVNSNRESRYIDVNVEVILRALCFMRGIRCLSLKRCTFDDPDTFFRQVGDVVPQLKKLNLNHNIQLSTEALQQVVDHCHHLIDLRIYCLSFNRIGSVTPYTDEPIDKLISTMGATLEVLKVNMLGLSDAIVHRLAGLSKLRVLHMFRVVNVQDDSLIQLNRLEKLSRLIVTVPRAITAEGWSELLSAPSYSNLCQLMVSNSYSVDDGVLHALAANCTALVDLGFPGCRRITDVGMAEVIINCRRLLRINLFSTKAAIVETFCLIPYYLPHLELLIYRAVDRSGVPIPDTLKSMTNLKVTSSYRYL